VTDFEGGIGRNCRVVGPGHGAAGKHDGRADGDQEDRHDRQAHDELDQGEAGAGR
jgi:hypothetical protein